MRARRSIGMTSVVGAILAGGQSRRFGSDKALAAYAGQALIEHVIAALRSQCAAVIVCGRSSDGLEATGIQAIPDRPAPHLGPLGGLNAALHYAQSHGYSHVLTAGCDTPRLPPDLLHQLTAPSPAFVRDLPVIGLWPVDLADALDQQLAGSADRSIGRWARSIGAEPVDLAAAVPNINTPGDLRALVAEPVAGEDGAERG